jgi:hypothetical protein
MADKLKDACWDGYEAIGMKEKNGKMVPNCVPIKENNGLSMGKSPNDIAKKHGVSIDQIKTQLKMGIKIEKEHTSDEKEAAKIAMDHLVEDPEYYTKLKTIESDELNENAPAIEAIGNVFQGLVNAGVLTPVQAAVTMVGTIALVAAGPTLIIRGPEKIEKLKSFIHDAKEKRKLTPEKVKEAITTASDAVRDLPRKYQNSVAWHIRTTERALESGDKGEMLTAMRNLDANLQKNLKLAAKHSFTIADIEPPDTSDDSGKPKLAWGRLAQDPPESPVPADVLKKAENPSTGMLKYGMYYDAPGTDPTATNSERRKYLGRVVDGKWVAAGTVAEGVETDELYEGEFCKQCLKEYILERKDLLEEAEYQGRKVPLGKPMRGDVKKFKVYVKDPKTGNVKKVNFGDKNMKIKKSNPARRKSFRARHNCKNPGPRTKARYWSCRAW